MGIGSWVFFFCFLLGYYCLGSSQSIRKIYPGFQTSQAEWKNSGGLFLLSNNSAFGLGFYTSLDVTMFSLGIIHIFSSKVVWTANRDSMVNGSHKFVFSRHGSVFLEGGGGKEVWFTDTRGQNATSMELNNSGNLVLLSGNGTFLWQSFNYPTDTLLSDQMFWEGMQLKGYPNGNGLSNYLEIKSGNLVLYAGYQTPQIYWSMANESRKTNISVTGYAKAVVLISNSWNLYDGNGTLLRQFIVSESANPNATWAAVLGTDGSISFSELEKGNSAPPQSIIPLGSCSTPEPCNPSFVCYFDNICQCPSILSYRLNCKSASISGCNSSSAQLIYVGDNLNYFALPFVTPFMISNLTNCQEACLNNCSCMVLFFESRSGSCYLFNQMGSFQRFEGDSGGYISFMKVEKIEDGSSSPPPEETTINVRKHVVLMSLIIISVSLTAIGLHILFYCRRRMKKLLESSTDTSEEDNFLDNLSGYPVRFRYSELRRATRNFSTKVGHGGFGSVYLGVLPDGTRLAVKKLERIGQGAKEFRAEVSLIGSTHHVNLVKLKGFCSKGVHRLLVYEYMDKGSLDKWIFKNTEEGPFLDWDTRFNVALGMAKALAYLHEECEVKIVHCDIKPENVLLDENFVAKVSDFGLAKLMNREQSFVCTQLRGTRGYVAPEWITNLAISDKSDVYSYGMVLLEIIGGRKNYDERQSSEKVHFPTYVFEMLEEQNLKQVVDSKAGVKQNDARVETAIKVALWCVQEEMHLRPPMSKVVQMLEGLSTVPPPPASQMGCRSSFSWSSGLGFNTLFSEVHLSDVRLSGPR